MLLPASNVSKILLKPCVTTWKQVAVSPFILSQNKMIAKTMNSKMSQSNPPHPTQQPATWLLHPTSMTMLLTFLFSCIITPTSAFQVPTPISTIQSIKPSHSSLLFSSTQDSPTTTSLTSYAAPLTEINRRRNLAIISHPDSGKTTMTEKLLLYGGALQTAGAVRMKGEQRATKSDFMEMEKQRGISIRYVCVILCVLAFCACLLF
jgi:hypothetical protein